MKNSNIKSISRKKTRPAHAAALATGDSNRLEFHRHADGRFTVAYHGPEDRLLFTLTVPRLKVKRFLQAFREHLHNEEGLGIEPVPLSIGGDEESREFTRKLLSVQPPTPLPEISGMTSHLRTYQLRGVEWLWFLSCNGLGGLLCDDIGLGKTHQVMALRLALKNLG
jgi:SNF2 family DNA or RNA helicase